jgi:hypothetical protein
MACGKLCRMTGTHPAARLALPTCSPQRLSFPGVSVAARSGPCHVGVIALLHFLFPNHTRRFSYLLGDTTYLVSLGHLSITNRGYLLAAAANTMVHRTTHKQRPAHGSCTTSRCLRCGARDGTSVCDAGRNLSPIEQIQVIEHYNTQRVATPNGECSHALHRLHPFLRDSCIGRAFTLAIPSCVSLTA